MNQLEYQREMCAFDEKIALAELEESKATQRVKELKFEKSRFQLNVSIQQLRDTTQPKEAV